MKHGFFKFTLILLAAFLSLSVHGKVVTQQKAMEFASRFFSNHAKSRSSSAGMKFVWDSNQLSSNARSSGESPTFYVFTPSDGKGFVIVAGDDASVPVLGYSFDNQIPNANELPQNLYSWLEGVHKSIAQSRLQGDVSSSFVKDKWTQSRAGDLLVLLETPTWNQRYPYNAQCPKDGSENALTGCTTVALATIMRYYEWPKAGRGTTEAYTTSTKGIYVNERDLNHQYDWDNMKMEYISGSYTNDEASAVATLMADIAFADQADFTSESTSSAAYIEVLYNHFDYHPGMHEVKRENYDYDEWKQLMIDELMKYRPIFYSGRPSDNSPGHTFVLDGCTTDDYFHINWGWGGYCDGYFYLNALLPQDGRDSDYSYYQWALLNMIPNDGGEVVNQIVAYQSGITTNVSDFFPYTSFDVTACVQNSSAIEFKGSFRLAVTDHEGNIKEWISNEKKEMNLPPRYYYPSLNFSCTINGDIVIGDRIRMFYKKQDSEEWNLITSLSSNIPWEILIMDEYTISESTSVSFDKDTGILLISFKDNVAATMLRNGEPIFTGITYNQNSVEIETKNLPEGIYTIKLEKGFDVKEFDFEVKPL